MYSTLTTLLNQSIAHYVIPSAIQYSMVTMYSQDIISIEQNDLLSAMSY